MEGFRNTDPVVMPDKALIPAQHLVTPAPNQFTHQLLRAQPYEFDEAGTAPSGSLPAGTKVVLMVYDRGIYCRVVDGQGRYVKIEYESLERL